MSSACWPGIEWYTPVSVPGSDRSFDIVRFGVFEVDLAKRELRKRGIKLNVQDQPFDTLAAMLERSGEIITREELVHRLWPEGTFVDFEHSVNTCVAKLRQALSDSADNPRFIETVPRRGYKFIAPIEFVGSRQSDSAAGLFEQPGARQTAPAGPRWIARPASWMLLIGVLIFVGVIAVLISVTSKDRSGLTLIRLTSDSGLTSYPSITNNGALLAYASDRAGNGSLDIWVQQPSPGARPIQITSDEADEYEPSFSPDGNRITYRSDSGGGGVYVVSALGGQPRLIAKAGRGPQFSPDGKWIAFWRGVFVSSPLGAGYGESKIFVVSADGGEVRVVDTGLQMAAHPVWVPDGKHLLVYGMHDPRAGFPLGKIEAVADWWVVPVSGGPARPTGAFAAFRQQQLAITYPAEIPRPAAWKGEWVEFYGRRGDAVNVWRVRMSTSDLRVAGLPERLSSGTGFELYPTPYSDNGFAFASLSRSVNVWRLPADTDRISVKGPLERLTEGPWIDGAPSTSLDGKRVVFHSNRSGGEKEEIWIKDTTSGQQSLLARGDLTAQQPQISPSGSLVAYTSGDADFVVPVNGGLPERLCRGCSMVWDWSSDENALLLTNRGEENVYIFNRRTNAQRLLLQRIGYSIYQARLSPDQRWVAFLAAKPPDGRLYVAQVRGGAAVPENDWIPLTEAGWSDKPRWSPDGNTLYYVADRDGFLCLWAQRLEPNTKRAVGPPAGVHHFHSARLSMRNVGFGLLEIGVARDSIVFNLGELAGNIWLARAH